MPFIPKGPLKTPVLLIIFNRPDTTRAVFEAIRQAKPPKLYVAADGPRPHIESDAIRCELTREVINDVDWDCEVKTLFRDTNLNCGVAPSSAFTWFFENEEQGIILEDDCLPSQSFFWYCEELLDRYKDDSRVMHIGGNNFLDGWQKDKDYSYYFSRSGHIWGWATWRRAWQTFDYDLKGYEALKAKKFFDNFFMSPLEKYYRLKKFDKTVARRGSVDWWDYQWDYARYVHNGLAIVPNRNMVKNIGIGNDATHTLNTNSKNTRMHADEIDLPLKHPPFMIRDMQSDRRYFGNLMQDVVMSKLRF
jgi:hypothetical protein